MKFKSLKIRFVTTIAIVYVIIAVLTFVAFHLVTTKVVRHLGADFAVQQAQLDKLKLLSTIQHDLSLSLRMSESALLQQWALDENNPKLKKQALQELESYRSSFRGQSLTFVSDLTKNYYFFDGTKGVFASQPRLTLNPDKSSDAWYFRVMREVDRFELNVDYDEHLNLTKVWFNTVIRDAGNKKIGVCGSNIDITEFIKEVVNDNNKGFETILFSANGAIVGHQDKNYVIHNSRTRGDEKKITVFDLIHAEADRTELKKEIDAVLHGKTPAAPLQLTVAGKRYLAAVSYIKEIRWFTLILLDSDHIVGSSDFLPILVTTIISLLAVLIIIGFQLNRIILAPISRLAGTVRQIAQGNFDTTLPVRSDDEIGALTRSFNDMAAMVKDYTHNLEQKIHDRTRRLEDTNYELQTLNEELDTRRYEAETALEALQSSQEKLLKLSRAVENSPATVVITDRNGNIEYVNPKFTEIAGYLPEEAIGQNPRILNAGVQSKEFYQELWTTISSGNEWRGEFCNKKKNGETHWEYASISPIRDEKGCTTHFVAVKEDITERRRVAEELCNARDAADAANSSKSEFLANMSHEIRTPLNAIIGFSSLAQNHDLPDDIRDYTAKINTAGKALLGIINDILDFSKIEAGKLEMEQINFRMESAILNVISVIQQKAEEKNIKLVFDLAPDCCGYFTGDPLRLGQVITNLASNAVKFTEKGEVKISVTLRKRHQERIELQFCVSDTGIGISPDALDRLFKPFTQADGSTTRKFGGTGLGLSISRQLVEMMGGTISAESKPGHGSTFSFTAWFGTGNASDEELPGTTGLSHDLTGLRILLVEDNEVNRQLAIILLRGAGAEVSIAVNGREAVHLVVSGEQTFDMVLMDVQMPEMDGYEATALIRIDSRFAALPIIAMTAHAMSEERLKILDAGMNDHIVKPIDSGIMFRTISRHRQLAHDGNKQVDRHREEVEEISGETMIPDIPGVDISSALQRLAGDRELYLWILRAFLENHSDLARSVEYAMSEGDHVQVERIAHTARGIAGNIGASDLLQAAAELENCIRNKQTPESIREALYCFAQSHDQLVLTLRAVLPD